MSQNMLLEPLNEINEIRVEHVSKRRKLNKVSSSQAKESRHERNKLWCQCRKKYQEGDFMFECEGGCGNFFHPKCVGARIQDYPEGVPYICPDCAAEHYYGQV